MARMSAHSGASQTPSWLVSYFDWAISSLAFSMSPAEFGVGYGSYVSSRSFSRLFTMMCPAISPVVAPPRN